MLRFFTELKSVLIAYVLLSNISIIAQNYAVQSTVLLNLPYTLSLPQYATEPEKFNVQLINKDFATPLVEVYLQLKIEGPGITLETKQTYRPLKSISLTAGMPVILNGNDLQDLFNSNNLNFAGLSQNQFLAGGSYLPEGLYRFSVRALEYHRNLQVSNWGFATVAVFKHLPPIINLPPDKSFVNFQNPQYLQIQFTPRHTVSPELINNIRYRIRLIEVMPALRNPNEAMLSTSLPFFEILTDQTTFIYGPGEPAMVEGRTYALQVQAIDVDGKDLFDNRGYSQIVSFVYGGQCPTPQNLKIVNGSGNSAELTWNENERFRSYMVSYKQIHDKVFKAEMAFSNVFNVNQLLPNTIYEFKVSGVCSESESDYSTLVNFKTTDKQSDYNKWASQCGKPLPLIDLSNRQPLLSLQAGAIIKAADFEIRVTSANGSDGFFSGAGLVTLPFTGKVPLPCTFDNIYLNEEGRLLEGNIKLIQEPLEISNLSIKNIAKTWRTLFGKNWNRFTTQNYPGVISKIYENEEGDMVIEGDAGGRRISKGANSVLKDDKGKTWYVSAGGKISEAEGPLTKPVVKNIETGEGTPSALPPGVSKLFFSLNVQDGVDALDFSQLTAGKTYDRMECADTNYNVGWKLAKAGEKFSINAIFVQGDQLKIPIDSVQFVRSDGTLLPCQRNGNEFTITGIGRMHLYADAIWAVANYSISKNLPPERWILGKVNIINVDTRKINIVLVPVNGVGKNTGQEKISKEMDAMLGRYGLYTSVKVDRTLVINDYKENSERFDVDKALLNVGYSKQLSRFIEAYKHKNSFLKTNGSNDTLYFLLLNNSSDNSEGFMNMGERYGFIFLNGASETKSHTIAHETGHGLFSLDHVFGTDISKLAGSQNLMDYAPPYTLLNYDQWMQIFDPAIKSSLFKDEDKTKFVAIKDGSVFKALANADKSYTFITYSGAYLTLPENVKNLRFSTLNRGYFVNESGELKPGNDVFPLGALTAFKIGDQHYHADTDKGYVDNDGNIYQSNCESSKYKDGIMVFLTISGNRYYTKAAKFRSRVNKESQSITGDGPLLRSFAVIDFEEDELNKNFETVMLAKKQGTKIIENIEAEFSVFGNDSILFSYRDTFYNASKFIIRMLSDERSVNDYIYYFRLANMKQNEYFSFVSCLSENITKRAILINDKLLAERKSRKGESAILQSHVNEDSEKMFNELYKIQLKDFTDFTSNGSAMGVMIAKANKEKWNGEKLYNHFKTNNYDRCKFYALSVPDRIYCVNTLIGSTDYWVANKINLIEVLLSTTPSYDELEMLKKGVMFDKFKWLSLLWSNRDEESIGEVFDVINGWVVNHYGQLGIASSTNEIVMDGITEPVRYQSNLNDFLIGIKENTDNLEIVHQAFSITCKSVLAEGGNYFNGLPSEITFLVNGHIKFEQLYSVNDIRPQLKDPAKWRKLRSVIDYSEEFNPFELMSVTLGGNYFPLGFKAGDVIELPAFMAMQLQENLEKQVSAEATKKLMNKVFAMISVASAVYTGGVSLNVASALFVATSTADNYMMDFKNSITTEQEWNANKDFFAEWDAFHTASEYALNIEGAYSLGKMAMPKLGAQLNVVRSLKSLVKYGRDPKRISKKAISLLDNFIADIKHAARSLTSSVSKLNNKSASVKIAWKNLDDKNLFKGTAATKNNSSAKSFAEEVGQNLYDAVLNEGFYLKFDMADGRILLGNTNGNFHGFAIIKEDAMTAFKQSISAVSEDILKNKLSVFLAGHADKLKNITGVTPKSLTIAGKLVNFSRTKTSTILGRYEPDIKELFIALGNYKSVGLGENVGGINILNLPDFYGFDKFTGKIMSANVWWEKWNKAWLEKVFNRGDDIYLATKPTYENIFNSLTKSPRTYAYEIRFLIENKVKPSNMSINEWKEVELLIKKMFE